MKVRRAARLIVIGPEDRVLFFRAGEAPLDPTRHIPNYWYLPGGAVEPGENFEDAARRELWEETGIRGPEIGPCVWLREQVLRFPVMGEAIAHERFFPVRVTSTEVNFSNMIDHEATVLEEHRWWSLDELRATSEVMFPEGVARHIEPILAGSLRAEAVWISEQSPRLR